MKKLFLVRHAKSSWDDPGMKDFDRPLNHRGKKDAPDMAKYLKSKNVKIDLIISSPAVRAITTANIFAEEFGIERKSIIKKDGLYEAGINEITDVIVEVDNDVDNLMVFGHNPGMTNFNNFVSDIGIDNLPTCGIIEIDFDIEAWKDIDQRSGKLTAFDYPKKLIMKN